MTLASGWIKQVRSRRGSHGVVDQLTEALDVGFLLLPEARGGGVDGYCAAGVGADCVTERCAAGGGSGSEWEGTGGADGIGDGVEVS